MTQPSASDTASSSGWKQQAYQQLQTVLAELQAARPDKSDPLYKDPATGGFDSMAYNAALSKWATSLGQIETQINNLKLSQWGLEKLPDGSVVATGDVPPDVKASIERANYANYADTMNKFGLSQWTASNQAVTAGNQRLQQDFENQTTIWDKLLGLDKLDIDTAKAKMDRWLSIHQEADKAAQLNQQAQQEGIKYGVQPGQTSFGAGDLGGIIGQMAAMAGIAPGAPLLQYTGTQTMDPLGDIRSLVEQWGGSGPAPDINLTPRATAGALPTPPAFASTPAPPGFTNPYPNGGPQATSAPVLTLPPGWGQEIPNFAP